MNNILTKDEWFMNMAILAGMNSKDPSTKVGAVIVGQGNEVISIGYNGFPRGINDNNEIRYEYLRYTYTEHAERNAIYNAARLGVSVFGSKIYVPIYPCPDCTRAIIQSGINEVVVHNKYSKLYTEIIQEDPIHTRNMFIEAGIKIKFIDCEPVKPQVFLKGKAR